MTNRKPVDRLTDKGLLRQLNRFLVYADPERMSDDDKQRCRDLWEEQNQRRRVDWHQLQRATGVFGLRMACDQLRQERWDLKTKLVKARVAAGILVVMLFLLLVFLGQALQEGALRGGEPDGPVGKVEK